MKAAICAVITVMLSFACGGASCVGGGGAAPAFFSLGAGGSLYGDGSAGAKLVAADDSLSDLNRNYTDFKVLGGAILSVPSGTVIRCTGTFTMDGRIRATSGTGTAARRGSLGNDDTTLIEFAEIAPHPGIARLAASSGEIGIAGNSRSGGFGGFGFADAADAVSVIYPPVYGGGGGGAGLVFGGEGGGSLLVLAEGGILVNGTVSATALAAPDGGGGGGAGGIVILATPGSLTIKGTISAIGGRGGDSDFRTGPGGGGAGGIIRLISPAISNNGTINVQGGGAGATGAANSVTATIRSGGGGGGACGPVGGIGGSVDATGTPGNATAGTDGIIISTPMDPINVY